MPKTKHRFSDGAKERGNMKKILVLSLLGVICFMPAQLLGASTCNSPVTLSFDGNQDPDDDEFLYTSWSEYKATESGYINTGKKTSGSGHGYECDEINSGGCGCGAVITLNKGHVFKGSKVNRKVKYQCNCAWDDYWKVVNDGTCYAHGFGELEVGQWLKKELTKEECSGYTLTDANGSKFKLLCREGPRLICKAVKCKPGYSLNSKAGTCTISAAAQNLSGTTKKAEKPSGATAPAPAKKTTTSTPAPAKKTSGGGTGGGGSSSNTDSQNCVNSGGTWKNRKCSCSGDAHLTQSADKKTCKCTAGYERNAQNACVPTDETNCKGLGASVAKWENNQCICLDTRQIYSLATKKCITNPEVTKCDKVADAKWTNGKCECIKQGYELKDGKCVKGAALVSSEQKESRTKITSVYEKLNAMSGDFKVSVWKNADGNFNTARLASDSIAAVVLGTTGALVTSNIVKKNQVSGGFEDISCQVGGQTVAGWGDEFNVGIQ